MNLGDLKRKIKSLAENDQSIAVTDMTDWLDDAIDDINTALKSNFSKATGQADTWEPEFDSRYHEALLIFAQKRYREADADYSSAQYWDNKFTVKLMDMQRDMKVPPSFRADPEVQQIVITDPTNAIYNLTMDFGSYFDVLEVYQNDSLVSPSYYKVSLNSQQITFTQTLEYNDKITIVFQENSDLNNPPYEWWGQTGW